jgi:uncharacterized membrane protein YphA (DoxX/SURF4 family)
MDLGLLLLHVVVGLLFVGHGSQKLFGVLGGTAWRVWGPSSRQSA